MCGIGSEAVFFQGCCHVVFVVVDGIMVCLTQQSLPLPSCRDWKAKILLLLISAVLWAPHVMRIPLGRHTSAIPGAERAVWYSAAHRDPHFPGQQSRAGTLLSWGSCERFEFLYYKCQTARAAAVTLLLEKSYVWFGPSLSLHDIQPVFFHLPIQLLEASWTILINPFT